MASLLISPLGSSASSAPWYKYDVFLNFRGYDVREGIISNLHKELKKTRHIKPFKDDEGLQAGMTIPSNLVKAIEKSRVAIVVLSPNYATSTWCLDELITIFRCMEGKDRILPLFYEVEPSDVRNQRGGYGEALSKLQETHDPEKVKQWRTALGAVSRLAGWDARKFKSERELVEHIVKIVRIKVRQVRCEFEREFLKYTVDFVWYRVLKLPRPIAVESTASSVPSV